MDEIQKDHAIEPEMGAQVDLGPDGMGMMRRSLQAGCNFTRAYNELSEK